MRLRQRSLAPAAQRQRKRPTKQPQPVQEPAAAGLLGNQAFAGLAAGAKPAPSAPNVEAAEPAGSAGWLSEESKSGFLAELREQVNATAGDVLAGTGFTPANCPWITYWFAYYAGRSARQIEQAAARYAPETRNAANAGDVIPLIAARIRRGVEQWALSGELAGVPDEVPARIPGGPSPTGVFFGGHVSGVTPEIDPRLLRLRLGAGQPLPAPVRSRMEAVFRLHFPRVRIHTDARADILARQLGARAFTVGQDIAFRAAEYRPGTPVGDALLAHELAHTVQQQSARAPARPSLAAEADAGRATRGAVSNLWLGVRTAFAPAFRGGLALQRCDNKPARTPADERARRVVQRQAPAPEPAVPTGPSPEVVRQPSATALGAAEVAETNPRWAFQRNAQGTGFRMNPRFWEVRYYVQGVSRPFVGNLSQTALQQVSAHAQRVRRGLTIERVEIVIRPGVTPVDAVRDMLNPSQQRLYAFECFTAQSLVQFAGVYRRFQNESPATADARFNANFADFRAVLPYSGSPELRMGGVDVSFGFNPLNPGEPAPQIRLRELLESSNDMGLLRGDWVYLNNSSFITSGAFQGENATYLGNKRFYGHGIGLFTIDEYVDRLRRDHRVRLSRDQILDRVTIGPRYRPPQAVAGAQP